MIFLCVNNFSLFLMKVNEKKIFSSTVVIIVSGLLSKSKHISNSELLKAVAIGFLLKIVINKKV